VLLLAQSTSEISLEETEQSESSKTILKLPPEILHEIFTLLEPRAALAFAGTSQLPKKIYELHEIFDKKNLALISKSELNHAEKKELNQGFYITLSQLFFPEIIKAKENNIKNIATVVEKFLKHLSKSDISALLVKAFAQRPDNLASKFAQLAPINMALTISLITALSKEELTQYKLSYDFILDNMRWVDDEENIKGFLEDLQQSPAENSALHFAVKGKYRYIAFWLLDHNRQSIDMLDINKETLLIRASYKNDKAYPIGMLLTYGPNIDFQDKQGFTALMHAVVNQRFDIVELLLANRASSLIENNAGETALSLAQNLENQELIELLESYSSPT
jgi:hypothetical protein